MEIDSDSMIQFIDVLVVRKGSAFGTKIYGKRNCNDFYLNTESNHLPHVERGIIQSLHSRASTIFEGEQYLFNVIDNLQRSDYPKWFIESVLNFKVVVIQKKRGKSHLVLYVLCKGNFREVEMYKKCLELQNSLQG
jgi:hypothetical protein